MKNLTSKLLHGPFSLFIIVPLLPVLSMVPSLMHSSRSISFSIFFTHSTVNMLLYLFTCSFN